MVMQVGMGSYFLGLVLVLCVLVVCPRIGLRQLGKCQVLGLILRFGMLPSGLLFLNSRASGFLPNRLDWR